MEIVFEKERYKSNHYSYGDLFIEINTGNPYILTDISFHDKNALYPIVLQSLNGKDYHGAYKDLDYFHMDMKINTRLKHFSKDEYLLELKAR